MISGLIVRSFSTGFLAACIVGPVFSLILYRTVTQGIKSGLASAAGMAVADGIFFFLAAMSGISSGRQCITHFKSFEIIGGPLMVFFGIWLLLRKNNEVREVSLSQKHTFFWQPLSALLLTLANPLTILFFGAVSGQVFPEIGCLSVMQLLLSSFFLSLGSFSLLSLTIILLWKQSHIDLESMIKFFKTLSGLGLLLTGLLLIFGHWASVRSWDKQNDSKKSQSLLNKK